MVSMGELRDLANLSKLIWKMNRKQEFGFSFNVADRCPIGCDCYWRAQRRVKELSDDQVIKFFNEKKEKGYLIVTLVGGEPYVRPELLEKITPIIPANWLVTSGTTPLRKFPCTTHFVSVDGVNAETHDAVRKSSGLYNRIIKNISRARAAWQIFPIYIHTVLNTKNQNQVREILRTWLSNGLADGVVFSTHTPIKGAGDSTLRLSRFERINIVKELQRCKDEFGDFLVNTKAMIRFLHPDFTDSQNPTKCGTAHFVPSFDASGGRMKQCILSEKADCTQCGCVITTMIETVRHFPPDLSSLRSLAKLRTN
ncbi:MAG: radical SAM protein [Parcubacteria group bacterium]|nr:radical SAM protein [Parcubacteria group bacterium]